MRENGVDLPPPNTTSGGPIFNTSSVIVTGRRFRDTEVKCAVTLRGAFGRPRRPAGSGALIR